jgi:polysaccharide deacetylase family protein (PEP-CTERM system associated)
VSLGALQTRSLPPGEPASVFTVDVEDWFHANFRSAPAIDPDALPRRVEQGVDALLDLLAAADARATFFVLGCVARDHPQLVRRIADAGHEIGCHGMQHDLVYEEEKAAFGRSVRDARSLLCDQSGQPVLGFRSPSWSLTEQSLWAFEALSEAGFRYDSSVFPAANYLYGIDGAPTAPYAVGTRSGEIIEVPPPIVAVGPLKLGVGGGFYLRLLPLWLHRRVRRDYARRGDPFVSYVHPREFDTGAWALKLRLSRFESWIHELRIASVRGRVRELLGWGRWCSMGDMLDARGWLDTARP